MNTQEPLMFHDVPSLPWNKVSGDIFEFKKRLFSFNGLLLQVY